jgi:hypothetical protein
MQHCMSTPLRRGHAGRRATGLVWMAPGSRGNSDAGHCSRVDRCSTPELTRLSETAATAVVEFLWVYMGHVCGCVSTGSTAPATTTSTTNSCTSGRPSPSSPASSQATLRPTPRLPGLRAAEKSLPQVPGARWTLRFSWRHCRVQRPYTTHWWTDPQHQGRRPAASSQAMPGSRRNR